MIFSCELPHIYVSADEHARLHRLADAFPSSRVLDGPTILRQELDRALVVEGGKLPSDVVRMNDLIDFRDDVTDQILRVRLVYPDHPDPQSDAVSVLSHLGAALLGLPEGKSMHWLTPLRSWRGFTVIRRGQRA